ncbi:MAG: hypothetical protein V3T53_14610 [Phycisphaerales bacterium]
MLTFQEAVIHAIIDAAVAKSGHGHKVGGVAQFAYDLVKKENSWERQVYQQVEDWVQSNVSSHEILHFEVKEEGTPESIKHQFDKANHSNESQPMELEWGDEEQNHYEWEVTAGAKITYTISTGLDVTLPGIGGASVDTSVAIEGSLELGRKWGQSEKTELHIKEFDQVSANHNGHLELVITTREFSGVLDVNIEAQMDPDANPIIRKDDFQHYHNVFSWNLVNPEDLTFKFRLRLHANTWLDVQSVYKETPISAAIRS